MKKLRSQLMMMITLAIMIVGMTVMVFADTATDLKDMKVYAVDASGNKTEVQMDFSPTTYSYDLTVTSDTVSISIEATVADSTSTWSIEKDGINTKMDFGKNLTVVDVKSASGVINKYTLNTTKLSSNEETTHGENDAETSENPSNDKTTKNSKDLTVKVGKQEMKISSSIDKNKIPEGFKKSSEKYNGTKYPCIKGEVKELTAFYLYSDETEGFYIYDSERDTFYLMNNILVKSRMYTIVQPDKEDAILKNYDKKKVTIINQEVSAWVLDEEEGIYLVYAMNWNGDTSLYSYDDNEKCFQRYIVTNDANTQVEAANKAYDNLQDKYNNLVSKYNTLLKILCVLVIILIILLFIIINISLNKKEKRVRKDKEAHNSKKEKRESVDDTPLNIEDEDEFVLEEDVKEEPEGVVLEDIVEENETPDIVREAPSEENEPIDLGAEADEADKQQTIEKKTMEAQQEAEDNLKETLKSILPEEQDEEDDDFEFIDLN